MIKQSAALFVFSVLAASVAGCSPETHRAESASSTAMSADASDPNSFGVEPSEVQISGQTVLKFTYPNIRAARLLISRLSADGTIIGTQKLNWNADPHFFRKDNVVILYVGNDLAVLNTLKAEYGEQVIGN